MHTSGIEFRIAHVKWAEPVDATHKNDLWTLDHRLKDERLRAHLHLFCLLISVTHVWAYKLQACVSICLKVLIFSFKEMIWILICTERVLRTIQ